MRVPLPLMLCLLVVAFLGGQWLAYYLDRHRCCPNEEFVDRFRIERPVVTCPESGWLP